MLSSIFDKFVQKSPLMPKSVVYLMMYYLKDDVLSQVQSNDVWTGDRNFCTAKFLFTIVSQKAFFVIRQHGSLGGKELSELKALGQTDTGKLFEQLVEIAYEGNVLQCRRIVLKLFKPTRDKEWEIAI